MRKLAILSLLLTTLLFTACKGQNTSKTISTTDTSTKIEVIDFFGTHRCVTCNAIEANSKYTIETYFADEPKVVFKTVNVDDDKNYKIAESFEASGTALFINVIHNGKEKHIDLTDFAFMKGNDKEAFSKELKAKIDQELAAL